MFFVPTTLNVMLSTFLTFTILQNESDPEICDTFEKKGTMAPNMVWALKNGMQIRAWATSLTSF